MLLLYECSCEPSPVNTDNSNPGYSLSPPPPPSQLPYKRSLASGFRSTSSSDVAPSLDESIDSGPLSDLQSDEDEGRRSAERWLHPAAAPPVDCRGGSTLVHQLLEDMKSQDGDPDAWKKIEVGELFLFERSSVCFFSVVVF